MLILRRYNNSRYKTRVPALLTGKGKSQNLKISKSPIISKIRRAVIIENMKEREDLTKGKPPFGILELGKSPFS